MARAFVGAHVAILEAWLAGQLEGDVEELATMALDLLVAGTAWAHGISLHQLEYFRDTSADAQKPPKTAKKARAGRH
jgi:hypothetical protein